MPTPYKILSLGGSLLAPAGGPDTNWLRRFKTWLESRVASGDRYIIIVGGGRTARDYIASARAVAKVSTSEADWVGIMATRLNAQLVIAVLGDLAHPEVISDPDTRLKSRAAVLVAAGCQPGNSTDYIAVRLARTYKARQVVNLTNIDYVYDRDPRFDKNAKGFRKMTWRQFRQLAGDKWQPGLSLPFDPLASSLAESLKMEVVIINGAKLPNLSRCLDGQTFTGTVINI